MGTSTSTTKNLERDTGSLQCSTLSDCLAVDQRRLAKVVFAELGEGELGMAIDSALSNAGKLGILATMQMVGTTLVSSIGSASESRRVAKALRSLDTCDTARGWAAFLVANLPAKTLAKRFQDSIPFADDPHFAVREWAWLAVRPHIHASPAEAVRLSEELASHSSELVRRFAVESTRPRGVWCKHIVELMERPEVAESMLTKTRDDSAAYVRKSVSNWLNDASKSRPDWVRSVCRTWKVGASRERLKVIERAMRSLKPKG